MTTMSRTTVASVLASLKWSKDHILALDVACGAGAVAEDLRGSKFTFDGLDPIAGYLQSAKSAGLYRVG